MPNPLRPGELSELLEYDNHLLDFCTRVHRLLEEVEHRRRADVIGGHVPVYCSGCRADPDLANMTLRHQAGCRWRAHERAA